jgi:hypothetical protein
VANFPFFVWYFPEDSGCEYAGGWPVKGRMPTGSEDQGTHIKWIDRPD